MKTDFPELFRKRYIPNELTHLKDDEILLYEQGKRLVTRWKTLNPKTEFARGISVFMLDRGIKVSKLIREDGSLVMWYCDIVEFVESPEKFLYTDLLLDVKIYPDGEVSVVDMDEAAEAFEKNLITKDQLLRALRTTDLLLKSIHDGSFAEIQELVENYGKM